VILREVDDASDDYLRKVRDLSSNERKREMEKIQTMFSKAKNFGDEKVGIAIQTYELVDKHIRRLDADLAKFEAEMKEKGRLSQTETEDEENAAEEAEKAKKRKKKKEVVAKKKSVKEETKKKGSKKKPSVKEGKAASSANADNMLGSLSPTGTGPLPPGMLPVPQEVLDMPVDPNEPTYCLCQQVSYGEMIGCDNNDCPIEWFHFGCMGLTQKPKGKW